MAFALRRLGKYDEAIENLNAGAKQGADSLAISLEKAATYRIAGDFESAEKEMKGCGNFKNVSAEFHYQLGRLCEAKGLYEEAVENYKAALELRRGIRRRCFTWRIDATFLVMRMRRLIITRRLPRRRRGTQARC